MLVISLNEITLPRFLPLSLLISDCLVSKKQLLPLFPIFSSLPIREISKLLSNSVNKLFTGLPIILFVVVLKIFERQYLFLRLFHPCPTVVIHHLYFQR